MILEKGGRMATRKELLEQYEDAQFALLMDEIMELQGEELRERSRQLKKDPAAAVPPEVRQRSMETIRTAYEERERGRKRHRIKTMVRTLLIAAVAATLLLGSVSADFRMAAKNFIYELTELAAELMFVFADDSAETHDGEIIMGYFIPALPDEFELIGSGNQADEKYAWRKYKSDDGFVIFVEKNQAAISVSEIVPEEISYKVISYNHHTYKGDLESKREILVKLAYVLEPKESALLGIDNQFKSDLFYLLNTLGLRHNNLDPEGKQYKAFVANMTNEELEHWYDETYQMCLLAFLRIEHIERKKAINELKKKVEAKDGNT